MLYSSYQITTFDEMCEEYENGKALPTVKNFEDSLSKYFEIRKEVDNIDAGRENRMKFNPSTQHELRFFVNAMRNDKYGEGVDSYSTKI